MILAGSTLLLTAAAPQQLVTIPLPSTKVLRFIVTGDAGTGDPHIYKGIMAVVKKTHVDAILLVGDNIYPCGVESVDDPQWHKMTVNFVDAGVPIYPVLGNHDYGDPSPHHTQFCGHPSPDAEVNATGHVPHWIFPARRYELRSPLAEIVMIDSQPIAGAWVTPFLGSDTAASELGVIEPALEQPFDGWKIVLGHHTIYSSGTHGHAKDFYTRNMRSALLPLFQKTGVDLYICGHDHDTELIGSLRHKKGQTEYLVAGNGAYSQPLHKRTGSGEPPTIFPVIPEKPLVGFTVMEISESAIDLTFYDGLGIARGGKLTMQRVSQRDKG